MNRRRIAVSLVVLAVVLTTALFFSDRVIDGPFPQKSKGMRFFEEREAGLNALVRQLESNPNVEKIVCYGDDVRIQGADGGSTVARSDQRIEEYLRLCHAAGAAMTWRVPT